MYGNEFFVRSLQKMGIQPLTVGPAHDKYEDEADHIAKQVVSTQDPTIQRCAGSGCGVGEVDELIQTKRLVDSITPLPAIQRKSEGNPFAGVLEALYAAGNSNTEGSFDPGTDFENDLNGRRGGGYSLSPYTKSRMEGVIGADFGNVRIHTGASNLCQRVGASAFTSGSDIFVPEGVPDDQTIAHELTHVVQQGAAPRIDPALLQ
jgi:hypothetical protein